MYERKLHLLNGMMLDKLEENGLMGFETILGKINFQKEEKNTSGKNGLYFLIGVRYLGFNVPIWGERL